MTTKTDSVAKYVREHVQWDSDLGTATNLRRMPTAQTVTPAKRGVEKKLNHKRVGLDSGLRRNDVKSFHIAISRPNSAQERVPGKDRRYNVALERFEKAFLLLPEEVLDLFLTGARVLSVRIAPDAGLPVGMATRSNGPADARTYSIVVREEHLSWSEDLLIGAFLRELGHVVACRPPETEWPQSRGERARYKEHLELKADAMVWRWGLRHYSMIHLTATYPEHWATKIVEDIGKMLLEGNETF